MRRDDHRLQIVCRNGLFPLRAPIGCVIRSRMRLNWPGTGTDDTDIAAADKTESTMIKIVAVKVVDDHPERAGADEGIDQFVVVENVDAGGDLIGIVFPDHAFAASGIIWFADAR